MVDEFSKKKKKFKDNVAIFPSDFFCLGSANIVPITENSYIKHHFIGSWLK